MTATAARGPSKDTPPATSGGPGSRRAGRRSAATVTGRGGVVIIFALGLLGALLSRWLGVGLLAGLGFMAGCVLAALATRPADLLSLSVCPPLLFLGLTLLAEILTTLGEESLLRGVLVGMVTSLATTAPWLFLGTALVVAIAIPRGLPAAVRDLRDRLAGSRILQEDENEDPVRWDESPRLHHGEVD
ncbi:hypothetical protein SAMN04489712_105234 [Thermomonospora echinospora]|uniref:DUF6542 domain-containing protein n=1 Tax=Thermomonospora echinospora TaxID=1992 RepID=A0A1H6A5V4_9ACTN|nr:DUF6542 domain-containing protein [Thermomonospora echinospora]SEG44123.1 hypothetical protein SAMN04489712_105234 [Thermomonospora echinospora]